MGELGLIIVGTVLVNNFLLVKFLGLCPMVGASQRLETAVGMALATTFVLTLAAGASHLLGRYVLAPLDLEYLRLVGFIVVIAGAVQFTEFVVRSTSPLLHQVLGLYLPLITTNCAVLGVALLNAREAGSLAQALALGLGAGIGFGLVLLLFAGIRERLALADVPAPFRGTAIALVTAGLMSLAFMGFAGLARDG